MKSPYTFSLTGIATDKTTIRYYWPDKCDYKIPFSTPTVFGFEKGSIVTQVFEGRYFKVVMLSAVTQENFSMYCNVLYPYYSFSYVLKGNVVVRFKGRKEHLVMRESYCCPGYMNAGKHQLYFRKGKTLLFYFIMEATFLEAMDMPVPSLGNLFHQWKNGAGPAEIMPFRTDGAFERLIKELQGFTKTGIALETQVLSILQELILYFEAKLLNGHSKVNKPVATIVHEVRNYIVSTVAKGPRQEISSIARQYFIGEKTLCRVFKDTFGITLKQFKLIERMKVAAQMREAGTSLSAIARALGYRSVYNLQREYQKHFQVKLPE